MDEAQIFATSRGTTLCTKSTLNLAAQARKYGLGLIFATQAPKNLHNGIPGNAAIQFSGRLTAPAQIDAANQIAKARGSEVEDIAKLNAGEFYGAGEGAALELIKVPMCLSYHPRSPLTPEEVLAKANAGRRSPAADSPGNESKRRTGTAHPVTTGRLQFPRAFDIERAGQASALDEPAPPLIAVMSTSNHPAAGQRPCSSRLARAHCHACRARSLLTRWSLPSR